MNKIAKRSKRHLPVAEINVVPYIDVMLVLLVIFMITTPLLTQGIQVQLPKAQAKAIEAQDKKPIIVTVDQAGKYYLSQDGKDSAALTTDTLLAELTRTLATNRQSGQALPPVYVKGDEQVGYGKVVTAMALIQSVGIDQVGLITETPEKNVKSNR